MKMSRKKITENQKSLEITLYAWFLIVIFSASLPFKVKSSYVDAIKLLENHTLILLLTILIGFFYSLPLIFSIFLLKRKNWARIGIMVISLLAMALNFYSMFAWKTFFPKEMVWILFFINVFMMLRSEKYRKEFSN